MARGLSLWSHKKIFHFIRILCCTLCIFVTYIHTSTKEIEMKRYITYEDIINMEPCYSPDEIGMPKNYRAKVGDFVKEYRNKVKDKEDILWVVCRKDWMTDRDMRLFAVWCAREALKLVGNPDQRSINACDVAERFANGEADQDELFAASDAAWSAASDATWSAARAAAMAVWSAAWSAASDAARAAASDAASDATWSAARAAARAAASDAARAASDAARAVWDAQIDKLLTYFEQKEQAIKK